MLERSIAKSNHNVRVDIELLDVADYESVKDTLTTHKPNVVIHAAAHKHVNMLERAPKKAIVNNVGGTLNLARASVINEVGHFVMVSTDKAVNPSTVMGASKRISERIVNTFGLSNKTLFTSVRFGNVIGSAGSIVPIFRDQIIGGGPVTVTHPEANRYFMSIPEAASLTLQACSLSRGGEIFVLDMGEPQNILEFAETLIKLSGLTPYEDIDIEITGFHPGEKISEQLIFDYEEIEETIHKKLLRVANSDDFVISLDAIDTLLRDVHEMKNPDVRPFLKKLVPEYDYESYG